MANFVTKSINKTHDSSTIPSSPAKGKMVQKLGKHFKHFFPSKKPSSHSKAEDQGYTHEGFSWTKTLSKSAAAALADIEAVEVAPEVSPSVDLGVSSASVDDSPTSALSNKSIPILPHDNLASPQAAIRAIIPPNASECYRPSEPVPLTQILTSAGLFGVGGSTGPAGPEKVVDGPALSTSSPRALDIRSLEDWTPIFPTSITPSSPQSLTLSEFTPQTSPTSPGSSGSSTQVETPTTPSAPWALVLSSRAKGKLVDRTCEWANVLSGLVDEEDEKKPPKDSSICKLALTFRESLYCQAAAELAKQVQDLQSEVNINDSIIFARDVEIANKKDEHEAEVVELKGESEAAQKAVKSLINKVNCLSGKVKALKSEVAIEQSIVLARNNEILDNQEDHEAEVKDLREQLELAQKESASRAKQLERTKRDQRITKHRLQEALNERDDVQARLEDQVDENCRLKKAELDVGFEYVRNQCYRYAAEQGNPAVTALFDGHIQRHKEDITRLEDELRVRYREITDEKAARLVDQAKAAGELKGMTEERDNTASMLGSCSSARIGLREELDAVHEELKSRVLYRDDVVNMIFDAHSALEEDNRILATGFQLREDIILAANKETAERDARIIELEQALAAEKIARDDAKGEKEAWVQRYDEMSWRAEMRTGQFEERLGAAQAEIARLTAQWNQLYHGGVPAYARAVIEGKQTELDEMRETATKWWHAHNAQANRATELEHKYGEKEVDYVRPGAALPFDYEMEELRRRVKHAEANMVPMTAQAIANFAQKGPLEVWRELHGHEAL